MPTANNATLASKIAPDALVEMLFDRMPMGIAVIDRAYRIQRYNPTWQDYSERYAPPEGAPLRTGVRYFDHLPGAESTVLPLYQRVLTGETIRQEDVRLELSTGVTYWDVTLAPLVEEDQVIGILNVTVDATERVQAQRHLEQRVEERTRELDRRREIAESLRDILGMINANIPLDAFLARAVKLAAQRLAATACVLHHFDVPNQRVVHLASTGMPAAFRLGDIRPFSAMQVAGGADYLKAALQGQPTYGNYAPYPERVAEIEHDSTIPENVKQQRIALREAFAGSLAVPLFAQDQVFGGLVFYYVEPQQFGEEQVQLAMTFAEQMALAIENARLRQDEQQRRQEAERRRQVAEGLRDTLSKINSSRSLDEVLDFVVMQADELSASKFVALYVQPDEQGPFEVRALRGAFPEAMRGLTLRPNEGVVGRVVAERRVIAIPDIDQIAYASSVQEIDENHPVFIGLANRDVLQEAISPFKAVLAIPLLTQNGIYGALAFYFPTRHEFQPDEVQLASAFADQAALAIENALLRGQATEMAKLAERSRLARDLHDAVTQTLFSASLIADVLPVLWQRNPDTGRQKLDELRMLTRGALSEMRTLLLELRPDTLTDVELGDLYRHLANAFSGRTRVPVAFTQEGQAPLPPEVKEAFYRVAQEALNNSAKHANASSVQLQLNAQPDWAEVAICDNGVGFDVAELMAENLGLKIMHERAEAIGARLSIDSQPGAGTRIELVWRLEDEA